MIYRLNNGSEVDFEPRQMRVLLKILERSVQVQGINQLALRLYGVTQGRTENTRDRTYLYSLRLANGPLLPKTISVIHASMAIDGGVAVYLDPLDGQFRLRPTQIELWDGTIVQMDVDDMTSVVWSLAALTKFCGDFIANLYFESLQQGRGDLDVAQKVWLHSLGLMDNGVVPDTIKHLLRNSIFNADEFGYFDIRDPRKV